MSGPYDLGGAVPTADIILELADDSGNPADPVSLPVLTVTLPDRSTVLPAVTKASAGMYRMTSPYVTTQAGHHLWSWTWSGTLVAATETVDSFEVRVTPDPTILALSESKEILKLQDTTEFDQEIRSFSQAVTEWVEYVCGPVVTRQETEVVRAQGNVMILSKAPIRTDLGTTLDPSNRRDGSTTNGLVSITPLMTYGFMYDLSTLLVDGPRGIVRMSAGLPFFYSADPFSQFQAVYWVGRKLIPWGITMGSKIALKHIWAVERGGSPSRSVTYGESETVQTPMGFAVPNRAVQLLMPHSGSASRAAIA